jgi:hypothetical protein
VQRSQVKGVSSQQPPVSGTALDPQQELASQESGAEMGWGSGAARQADVLVQQQAAIPCEKSKVSKQRKQLTGLTERIPIEWEF